MVHLAVDDPGAGKTTERVAALMRHPDFFFGQSEQSARSVVGAFANANPTRFHALDGSGYDLLANTVLELDSKNLQLAARLLSALRSWRTLEERRALWRKERCVAFCGKNRFVTRRCGHRESRFRFDPLADCTKKDLKTAFTIN